MIHMSALLHLAPAGGPWGGFMLAAWWSERPSWPSGAGSGRVLLPVGRTLGDQRRSWALPASRFDPESHLLSVPLLPSQSLGWLPAAPDDWHGGVVGGAGAAAPLIGLTGR